MAAAGITTASMTTYATARNATKEYSGKLVLMDLDGTAFEMWGIHTDVYAATMNSLFLLQNVNFLTEGYVPGESPETTVRKIAKRRGVPDAEIDQKIPLVKTTMAAYYPKAIEQGHVTVLPGVLALLTRLKDLRVVRGVVTGNYSSLAGMMLAKTGLRVGRYFEFDVTSDDSGDRRERLRIAVREGEKTIGRKLDPADVYFFDDSDGGIDAAREVGIIPVSVATGAVSYKVLHAKNPDYAFRDLMNTNEVLKKLGLG